MCLGITTVLHANNACCLDISARDAPATSSIVIDSRCAHSRTLGPLSVHISVSTATRTAFAVFHFHIHCLSLSTKPTIEIIIKMLKLNTFRPSKVITKMKINLKSLLVLCISFFFRLSVSW